MSKQSAPIPCFHCGLPVPKRYPVAGKIQNDDVWYCCIGCKAVAETIQQSGFGQYYQLRDSRADKPAELFADTERYIGFDQIEVLDEVSTLLAPDNTTSDSQTSASREILLSIEGIHCAACVWLIERQVSQIPGVQTATVNLSNHRARIQWDPAEAKLSSILAALQSIGYTGHPFQPHAEEAIFKREQKQAILRLGIAAIGMAQAMMYAIPLYFGAGEEIGDEYRNILRWASLVITTPVVFISAWPFFTSALRDIQSLRPGMDVPVSLAVGGGYIASVWATITYQGEVYFDSVSMFTFFLLLSRYIEMRARHSSGRSEQSLHRILPDFALKLVDDTVVETPIKSLHPGDRVLIKSGEIVPVDGEIESGISQLNEATMTGEFYPISKQPGDTVLAGTGNIENPIKILVTKTINESRLNLIENLLEQVQHQKPKIAQQADKVAGYFVSAVLLISVLVYSYWRIYQPESAFWITLSVLVVTCPCALSLATPTAITAAVHALRKIGFLITGKQTLPGLAATTDLVFDKTGTLTVGELRIDSTKTTPAYTEAQVLELAKILEEDSEHPIARAFKKLPIETPQLNCTQRRQRTGLGVEGIIGQKPYRIGQQSFVAEIIQNSDSELPASFTGSSIFLADGSGYIASFKLNDQIRDHTKETIDQLKNSGLQVSLISGDSSDAPQATATQIGISTVFSSMLPEQKVEFVTAQQKLGKQLVMVGDGINDAPVLSASDVSIAMGSGTDLAKTHADAVLLTNDLSVIPMAIQHAKKTQRIIWQNISWAILYNLTALPLAASGSLEPYMAAIGMSASSLIVVANAYRLTRIHS
ncbi:MAG: cadmium-translocating P-type ATPase [Pseudomonadales bacterium]|nr:cadmium-translocating P-type ATPase [Pseudomonadales bacterium]